MKFKMTKFLAVALSAAMVVTGSAVATDEVVAAEVVSYTESEIGKDYSYTLGKSYLERADLSFTATDNGYMQLRYTAQRNNLYPSIQISDESGVVYFSDSLIDSTGAYSPKFAVKKGDKIYLNILGNVLTTSEYAEVTVNLSLTKSSFWEKENNNTISTANKIKPKKTYYGGLVITALNDYDSTDCYKFTLKKASKQASKG